MLLQSKVWSSLRRDNYSVIIIVEIIMLSIFCFIIKGYLKRVKAALLGHANE